MAYQYENVKLEKGMYGQSGRSFLKVLESLDPSENYKGTALEGLDAFQRQLKRFDAQERAEQIAEEWSRAMQEGRNGSVRDFVSVGDVSIKAIGADNQILDSETPVRQILEQLVAKTGLPPFMLGLSWSSTERMSAQQADMLTSEITALRRTLEPVIERVCTLWLRMHGYGCRAVVDWEDINLQDEVEEAKAALYLQQARKLRQENDEAEGK